MQSFSHVWDDFPRFPPRCRRGRIDTTTGGESTVGPFTIVSGGEDGRRICREQTRPARPDHRSGQDELEERICRWRAPQAGISTRFTATASCASAPARRASAPPMSAFNRDAILDGGAAGARGATSICVVYPELCLSSYAIDDLIMQDALLDAVERGDRRDRRGSADLAPVLRDRRAAAPQRPALQLRAGRSRAARCSASCPRASCPITANIYEKRWFAHGRDIDGAVDPRSAAAKCRSAPT